ncbi:MAG: TonB-dependent receptor [Gemmatimonadales bacterium]
MSLVAGPAAAQTVRLSVEVTGEGRPIAAARVSASGQVAEADGLGRASLTLEPGVVIVRVAAIGWVADSLSLRLTADTTVAIALLRAPTELEEVVASVTRSARRVEDEAIRVEVLDLEEIEEKVLMTPGDIVMMLNETGGVRVQTSNPSLGGAGIRIRGLDGRYTLVLADGLPLFGERIGAFGPLQIPPLDLGRVELVKGVASALAGGAALGGVVNLVSRRPESGSSALLNLTSLGGTDAASYLGASLGSRWGGSLLAGLHTQPRRDRNDDGWADVPGYERVVVRPRLFYEDGAGGSLLATLGATVETRRGGTLDGEVAPDGLPFPERLATTSIDVGLIGGAPLGPLTRLSLRASAATRAHRHRFGPVSEPDRHLTGFGEAVLSRSVGAFDLVGGAALGFERYRSERYPALDYRRVTPAVFGQLEHGDDRGAVSASLRVDAPEGFGVELSPRVSALVKPTDGWSIRATAGLGFTVPTPLVDETERTGLSRLEPLGDLETERALSGAIDLHGELGALELNASAFATRVSRPAQFVAAETPGRFRIVNAELPTRSVGADLSLAWRREGLAVIGSYAFVAASEADPDGDGRRRSPLTPRHTAGMVAVREGGWGRIGLELYFTGPQSLEAIDGGGRSPSFLIVGLLAERRLGGISVFVNGEDLTDVRQTRTAPLLRPSRAPDGSWTVDAWGPLDGRVLNVGIRRNW